MQTLTIAARCTRNLLTSGAKPRRWQDPWDSPGERADTDGVTGRIPRRGTVDEPG